MSKKFTVYLGDDEAKRLELEASPKASPGKIIKERLVESWHKEDTAPVLPKAVQTDSIFTKGGDEIKRHVSDNVVSMLSEGTTKPLDDAPSSFTPDHAKVLTTINNKREQKNGQFGRSDIAKESKVPSHIVDEVIKTLLHESRIKKVGYNTYAWTLYIPNCEECEERIEPIVNFLTQNNAKPN